MAKKTTQAAALLLKLKGTPVNYTWMLKVLYLADRASLIKTGRPISGATFCSTTQGPHASDVYDCIKGASTIWNTYIAREGRYDVKLLTDPDDGELSDFEVETLTDLYDQYKERDWKYMVHEVVHKLPEWVDPGSTSHPLDVNDILAAGGWNADDIAVLEHHNQHIQVVNALFKRQSQRR